MPAGVLGTWNLFQRRSVATQGEEVDWRQEESATTSLEYPANWKLLPVPADDRCEPARHQCPLREAGCQRGLGCSDLLQEMTLLSVSHFRASSAVIVAQPKKSSPLAGARSHANATAWLSVRYWHRSTDISLSLLLRFTGFFGGSKARRVTLSCSPLDLPLLKPFF